MKQTMNTTRRAFITASGSALLVLTTQGVRATPEAMQVEIRKLTGGAKIQTGRVTLDIPPLVENGNTISMSVLVDSLMSPKDHVKAILVFNEKKPQPHVITAHMGPRSGRATLSTRIRLADSQTITAIAEMGDGTFFSGKADVIVTIAACLEDIVP